MSNDLGETPVSEALAKFRRSQAATCSRCGKPRLPNGDTFYSPVKSCACSDGLVDRADQWSVIFARAQRGNYALVYLKPASGAFSPFKLHENINVAPSDTEARDHIVPGSGFEWGEISNASRRLAFNILALVAGVDRADRHADAFMREWLAVKIAKQSERTQSVTLGEVRTWVSKQEASAGAAA